MTVTETSHLRTGTVADLAAVNAVVDAAVLTWNLPERVKRLALPSYRYHAQDLDFLELIVALDEDHQIIGVAGFEAADPADVPAGYHTLLLHGIYVLPEQQRRGIGRSLLHAVENAAGERGFDSVLVKAQADADGFFVKQGLGKLPIKDTGRDYPHRFWKAV